MRAKDTIDLPEKARLLLVRLSALGDILFALESLAALKAERPDVRVDFLVEDRFAALLQDHPLIDELIVFPRRKRRRILGHVWHLRRKKYAAVLDLHGILKSSWQVFLARGRHKVGYAPPGSREGSYIVYNRRVELPTPLPHRAARGAFLLRELGLRHTTARAELPITSGVPEFFADTRGARVILHPGTSTFAKFKRWPMDRFATLADRLQARGMAVAMSFGPGEEGLLTQMQERTPGVIPIDGRALGLSRLAQAMRQAQVVVAADTGPLHIATAVGARVVALFGPKAPALYGPRGEGHRVLFHDVPCRPCRLRTCPSPQCVLGIDVDRVEASVLELTDS